MAQAPITTIVPFADRGQLPACAVSCGHLYDANGACVPPALPQNSPEAYTSCFCADPRVAAFSTTTAGVCDNACTTDPNGLSSITSWFHDICKVKAAAPSKPTTSAVGTGTNAPPPAQSGASGDWISSHWKWVLMLVILIVAIAGIWIGACLWRRRYLRKRDLQKVSGRAGTEAWAAALPTSEPTGGIPMTYSSKAAEPSASLPKFNSAADEKRKSKGKKKWFVGSRT